MFGAFLLIANALKKTIAEQSLCTKQARNDVYQSSLSLRGASRDLIFQRVSVASLFFLIGRCLDDSYGIEA